MYAYLGVLQIHSQNCHQLFLLDSHRTYRVHFPTIEVNDIPQSLTAICLSAIWRIVLVQ